MTPAPVPTATHRLRGLVEGVEKTFLLEAGEHGVGSSRSNDVVLPVRGVSRQHAILKAGPEGLRVEDLDSLNGTFLDEHRVEEATVAAGTELRFGTVRLRVERLEPEDAELAIVVDLPPHLSATASRWADRSVDDTTQLDSLTHAHPAHHLVFPEGYLELRSPAMSALYRQMAPLARGEIPVLVLGETGVGKELIARTLHRSSPRRSGPFVAINCAAIPADLLEAEMFGIGKGVATGVERREGKFDLAQQGTLFLDEIGEMAAPLQAKLLRALQEKEIHPVGGRVKQIDVRVVAATNAHLAERMDDGSFRRDLYYRLAGSVLEVPALREVRDDVARLVEHFLKVFCHETGRRIRGVTVKALELLTAYDWPGNVRQLENEVRRLVYQSPDGEAVDSALLSAEVRGGAKDRGEPAIPLDPLQLEPRLLELETCLVREAMRRTDGNQTRAAQLLGITRNGLAKKLKRLDI